MQLIVICMGAQVCGYYHMALALLLNHHYCVFKRTSTHNLAIGKRFVFVHKISYNLIYFFLLTRA